jgi:DNA polymerase III subunit delta'
MSWNSVIGQDRVKTILKRSFLSGKTAHAYLFYGPEGTGKDASAVAFAKVLNCEQPVDGEPCDICTHCKRISALQHPNLKIIIPLPVGKNEKEGDDPFKYLDQATMEEYHRALREKAANPYLRINLSRANTIKINSIREIRKTINLARAEEGKKVIIISGADMMNEYAQNSLLKTLEEPASNTVLILTTSRRDALRDTIISRCQLVRFELLREDEIRTGLRRWDPTLDEQQVMLVSKMANGNFTRAQELTGTDLVSQREEVIDLLRNILARSPSVWMKEIDEFLVSSDRHNVIRSLMLLNLWLRDALMIQNDNTDAIINLDQREPLTRFIKHFKSPELPAVINAIERAIALVEKNIYISLILINLAFDIRHFIARQ